MSVTTTATTPIGEWSHVVATWKTGDGLRVYLNGAEAAFLDDALGAFSSTDSDLISIGAGGHSAASTKYAFNGEIDDVTLYTRALEASEIEAVYNAGASGKCVPTAPTPSGLVAAWRGEGHAADFVGANHGVLKNGVGVAAGLVGQAFELDGIDDHVEIPDDPSLTTTSAITVEGWINPSSLAAGGTVLSQYDSMQEQIGWGLVVLAGGSLRFTLNEGGAGNDPFFFADTTSPVVSANEWTHVAASFDAATDELKIFVNGVDTETPAGSGATGLSGIFNSSAPVRIGAFRDINGDLVSFFDGLIDEVSLYNRALSESEVAAIHAAGSNGKGLPDGVGFIWNGGSGNWTDAAKWTPEGVPGIYDAATINSGTVTIDAEQTVSELYLNDGTLTGANDIAITRTGRWSDGVLAGGGTFDLLADSTFEFSGNSQKDLQDRTINLAGTATWSGSGNILAREGGTLNILSSGVFDAQNNQSFYWNHNGGAPVINNAGMFRKSSGAGTTTLDVIMHTTGTVDVQSGILLFTQDGASSSEGAFTIGMGAIVRLNSNFNLNNGATCTGDGVMELTRQTTTITGTVSVENFAQHEGSLDGTGDLSIANRFDWTDGSITGSGALNLGENATFAFSGSDQKDLNGRMVNHSGTAVWTGSGNILARNGAVFNNLPGALFDVRNNQSFYFNANGGMPNFNNMGTLQKTAGTGTSIFDVNVNNSSLMDAQTGVIRLTRGGTSNGDYLVADAAEIDFGSRTHNVTLGATRSISGAGTIRFSGASVTLAGDGTYDPAATAISGGEAEFNLDATSVTLDISGGDLSGGGTFIVGQTMNWTGGGLDGGGVLELGQNTTLDISGSAQKDLSHRTVNLDGSAAWTGGGNILARDSGVLNILENGVFDARNNLSYFWNNNGGAPVINNPGVFRKSSGTGTTTMNVTMHSTGTVDIQTGVLLFDFGGSSSGVFTLGTGTTARLHSNFDFSDGATSTGDGEIELSENTTTIAGTVNVENLSRSAERWTGRAI